MLLILSSKVFTVDIWDLERVSQTTRDRDSIERVVQPCTNGETCTISSLSPKKFVGHWKVMANFFEDSDDEPAEVKVRYRQHYRALLL